MGKKLFIGLISIFVVLCMSINVYAEEDNSQEVNKFNECEYKNRAELNKIAAQVEATYEIKHDDEGKPYIKMTVFNVTEDLTLSITNSQFPHEFTTVTYEQVKNGMYSWNVYDTNTIMTYTIEVRGNREGCRIALRKIKLVKPRYNDISELHICKNEQAVDYIYCQPWVTQTFPDERQKIIEKINRYVGKEHPSTTTVCKDCNINEEAEAEIKRYNEIRMYVIIGLSVGSVLDIINIIVLIYRIKRYSI